MNRYETVLILKASLEDNERDSLISETNKFLEANGVEFLAQNKLGIKNLAYPIKKSNRGFYFILYYKAKTDFLLKFEQYLRHNENILKFLTIKFITLNEVYLFDQLIKNCKSPEQQNDS